MINDRENLFVNYDYRSNSSRNFIEFDLIYFEIYLIFKKMTKNCLCKWKKKIIPIEYNFGN